MKIKQELSFHILVNQSFTIPGKFEIPPVLPLEHLIFRLDSPPEYMFLSSCFLLLLPPLCSTSPPPTDIGFSTFPLFHSIRVQQEGPLL